MNLKLTIQLSIRFALIILTAMLLRDVVMSILFTCHIYGLSSGFRQLIFAASLTAANWIDGKLIGPKSVFAKLLKG